MRLSTRFQRKHASGAPRRGNRERRETLTERDRTARRHRQTARPFRPAIAPARAATRGRAAPFSDPAAIPGRPRPEPEQPRAVGSASWAAQSVLNSPVLLFRQPPILPGLRGTSPSQSGPGDRSDTRWSFRAVPPAKGSDAAGADRPRQPSPRAPARMLNRPRRESGGWPSRGGCSVGATRGSMVMTP